MDMSVRKVCTPAKIYKPGEDFQNPQNCIQTLKAAAGKSGTDVHRVYNSNSSTTKVYNPGTRQSKDLNELPTTEQHGYDTTTTRVCDDEDTSDEDNDETYGVIVVDTLSTGSSSPELRNDSLKTEFVSSSGDAVPNQVNQPFSIKAGGDMYNYSDKAFSIPQTLSPTPAPQHVQHFLQASKTSSYESMHQTIKEEPLECGGQFTYSMSSLELESQMVDKAIDNLMTLPQVFTEVVENKKSQSVEIEIQQLKLTELQKQLEEAKNEVNAVRDDVAIVTHNISSTQKSVIEGTKQCNTLYQEVSSYVLICEDINQAVRYKQEEYDLQKSKIDSYKKKIADYVRTVDQHEILHDTVIELRNHEEDVKRLHDKKKEIELNKEGFMDLMDGTWEIRVTDKITYLIEQIEIQTKCVEDKTKLIEDLRNKQRLLDQSILVLQKRNAAQLTRLKRHLKEVSVRRRRWNDQISHLKNVVADLKQQLQK